jgi:hypothetical protein
MVPAGATLSAAYADAASSNAESVMFSVGLRMPTKPSAHVLACGGES